VYWNGSFIGPAVLGTAPIGNDHFKSRQHLPSLPDGRQPEIDRAANANTVSAKLPLVNYLDSNFSEPLSSGVYALPGVGYDAPYIDMGEALC
jgi:hypothetical protein